MKDVKDVIADVAEKRLSRMSIKKRQLMMSRKTAVVDVAKIEDIDESVKDVNNVKDVEKR